MTRKFDVSICHKCGNLVSDNWYIAHVKSGCKTGVSKWANPYKQEANLVVAKILEDAYVNNKIENFIDPDRDDKFIKEVVSQIKIIIDLHVEQSKR